MKDIQLETDDGRLGEIIDDVLSKMARGESVEIEQYAREHPDVRDLLHHALPALQAIAPSNVSSGGASQQPERAPSDDELNNGRTLGDFQIRGELGRGGMGVVYEAEQISLGRRVALKVLPFAGMVRGNALQRFRNEVRAVATLDHLNIVSVYSVGEERGVHYYAMQLIRGQSMAEVIEQLRLLQNDGRELGGESVGEVLSEPSVSLPEEIEPTIEVPSASSAQWDKPTEQAVASTIKSTRHNREFYRSLALLIAQAADALEHAHQNGVLHRDIKPGNLMLDADSQLYVTDFGLAQIESDATLTVTGDLIGTLRYMSPEQALAKRVTIDHRSDIYSLGATLHELLTLEPVFSGSNRQELLKQIAFDEPRKLRQIVRGIPHELETIVLKSIEKDPNARYATAGELADDLRAFVEHRPIKAKPATLAQRTGKWARRHRVFVNTALVAVILLICSSAGLMWWSLNREANLRIEAEHHAEEANAAAKKERIARSEADKSAVAAKTAKELAEQRRIRAEKNFDDAVRAVDQMLLRVGGASLKRNPLLSVRTPEVTAVQADLLNDALEFYRSLLAQDPTSMYLRVKIARTQISLAIIYRQLRDYPAADAEFAAGIASLDELAEQGPDDVLVRFDQAYAHGEYAHFTEVRTIQQREQSRRRAAALRRALMTDYPDEGQYRIRLAIVCSRLADLLAEQDKLTEARRLAVESTEIISGAPNALGPHSRAYSALARIQRRLNELPEADESFEVAIRYSRDHLAEDDENRHWFAFRLTEHATLLREIGKDSRAEDRYREAAEIWHRLAEAHPSVDEYQRRSRQARLNQIEAGVAHALAADAGETGYRKAAQVIAESLPFLKGDVERSGHLALAHLGANEHSTYRQDCERLILNVTDATTARDLKIIAWACSVAPDGLIDYDASISTLKRVAAERPEDGWWLIQLGYLLYRANRLEEALDLLENNDDTDFYLSPACRWFFLAMVNHRLERTDEAKRWFAKAVAWTDQTLGDGQDRDKVPWPDRLTVLQLRVEAEALFTAE